MTFLISLLLTIFLIAIGRNFIKKHSKLCYIVATLVSVTLIFTTYSGIISTFPNRLRDYILPIFTKSSFATAIFVVVMYTGAFKNGSKLIKFLMPIRAELSIIASILTLAHNIIYGKTHFVKLFTNPATMPTNMIAAAIISIILILIMLPLMITSFPKIRKKMKPKAWKKLQRLAYAFYGLIYIHIMLIMLPLARKGMTNYKINVLLYSIVFLTYAAMRIRKELLKKKLPKYQATSPVIAFSMIFCIICGSTFYISPLQTNIETDLTSSSSSNEEKQGTEIVSESINDETISEVISEVATNISFIDGTYTGSASGYNGKIDVEVTVINNAISSINILSSADDSPFIDEATSGVTSSIIKSQGTDVDTVSGATFSSKGIINAVKIALKNAKN